MGIDCYRKILNKADKEEIQIGKNWYFSARDRIIKLSIENGLPSERVAGIMAVLSPMVEWSLNFKSAKRFIKTKGKSKGPGFRLNYRKAKEVLRGNLDVIKGPKVYRFYRTLLDPLYPEPVIDSQMIAAYYNGGIDREDIPRVGNNQRKLEELRNGIKSLAIEKGENVSSVQAIIWITFKRLKGPYAEQLKIWR